MRIILLQVFLEEGLYLVIRNDAGDVVVKIDVGCSGDDQEFFVSPCKKAECLAPSEGLQR